MSSVKEIELTRGKFTLVDAEDYTELAKYKWRYDGGYAVRGGDSAVHGRIKMERQLIQPPANMLVDHIDNDKLNNRRVNLRVCTFAENCQNRKKSINGTSQYIGVSKFKQRYGFKWQAHINDKSEIIYLGLYDTEEEAARARDKAIRARNLTFYKLNFPDERACNKCLN